MSMFKHASQVIDIEQFKPKEHRKADIEPIMPIVTTPPKIVDSTLWNAELKKGAIQKIYQNASLENCPLLPQGIVELGKRWARAKNRASLYLYGNTGSGKTYFAYCLYRAMIERKIPWILFVKSYDLDEELLVAIEEKQEKSRIMKYCDVPILFIDDLGVERPSDRIIRQYYSIIDRRVGDGLTTIITSNVSKDDLPLGDRISSRLGHFYAIEFPKRDNRNNLNLPPI